MKNFGKGIGGALLSLAFVLGVAGTTVGTAQAQNRRGDDNYQRRDRDRDRNDDRRRSKRRHRDDNDNDNWRRNRDNNGRYGYGRNGNNGNGVGGYGNNGRYGTGGYGNNGGYNQVEVNRGYQQGVETGASDGQRGQSYNPQRSHHFKNASSQAFRQGFVQGYDQGYRQYSGGNQRNRNNTGWGNVLGGVFGRP
jgi:hypothetical protein